MKVHKWSPGWLGEWAGLVVSVLIISASVTAGAVKLLGLDTVGARQAADAVIAEEVREIHMQTWCLLWEVPAETCRVSFNSAGQP